MTGASAKQAQAEVDAAIRRTFFYAGLADKYDGAVHATRSRHVTLAMNEPWGVMGIVCPDEAPLLALISLVMPAIAMGNRVVVAPSPIHPLAATDLYQVLDTSDVPAGVVNIVTGERDGLAKVLAEHEGVDALWYCGSADGAKMVEAASISNLKATWTDSGMRATGCPPKPRGASSCAARPRSRISGCPTASDAAAASSSARRALDAGRDRPSRWRANRSEDEHARHRRRSRRASRS